MFRKPSRPEKEERKTTTRETLRTNIIISNPNQSDQLHSYLFYWKSPRLHNSQLLLHTRDIRQRSLMAYLGTFSNLRSQAHRPNSNRAMIVHPCTICTPTMYLMYLARPTPCPIRHEMRRDSGVFLGIAVDRLPSRRAVVVGSRV